MKLFTLVFFSLACPAQIADDFGLRLLKFYQSQVSLMFSYFDCPKGATTTRDCRGNSSLLDASVYNTARNAAKKFYDLGERP